MANQLTRLLLNRVVLTFVAICALLAYRPLALLFFGLGISAWIVGNSFHRAVGRAHENVIIGMAAAQVGFLATLREYFRTGRVLHGQALVCQLAALLSFAIGFIILLRR